MSLGGLLCHLRCYTVYHITPHAQLSSVLMQLNVVGEWDFVNQDGDTGNDGDDPADQDAHGTAVLSVLAAYAPGRAYPPSDHRYAA